MLKNWLLPYKKPNPNQKAYSLVFLCIKLFGETPVYIEAGQAFWTHKNN